MNTADTSHVAEILAAAELVLSFVEGVDREAFALDLMRRKAVAGRIIAIAGSARRISEGFRAARTEIDWNRIFDMSDRIIRGSDEANLDDVWTYATVFAPELKAHLSEPEGAEGR